PCLSNSIPFSKKSPSWQKTFIIDGRNFGTSTSRGRYRANHGCAGRISIYTKTATECFTNHSDALGPDRTEVGLSYRRLRGFLANDGQWHALHRLSGWSGVCARCHYRSTEVDLSHWSTSGLFADGGQWHTLHRLLGF